MFDHTDSRRRPHRRVVAALCLLLTAIAMPATTSAALPDYSTSGNIATGAYIVDMGVTPQTIANGLMPYGLVYDLVVNNQIPVTWAIDSTKAREGVDFSYDGTDYSGGPFIIEAEFASEAAPIIAIWQGQGVVVDGPTTSPIEVPVYERVTAWPNAVLDAKNGGIAAGYYENAGIPESNYRIGLPSDLDSCDDIYIMPHADPEWGSHQNLVSFNDDGGYIWAACHAVSVLENVFDPADPNPDPDMNFLSTNGLIDFGDHDGGSPPYSYVDDGGDPILQFLGVLDGAQQNGSEQIYMPSIGSGWRPSTNVLAWDPDQADVVAGDSPGEAATLAYGRGFGDETNGLVMFEGGHSHNKGPEADLVAAQRAFFNLHLLAGIERGLEVDVTTPSSIASGSTVPVSAVIDGGALDYDYTWTSSCGGTFDTPTGSIAGSGVTVNANFTAPTGSQDCSVKLLVQDTCQRDAFGASGTEIVELADLQLTKSVSVDPVNAGSTLDYTLTATNAGPSAATGVTITDSLPAEVTYLTATPSQGTCALVAGKVECDIGALGIGASATVTVTVETDPTFEGTLTNTAVVAADQFDPNSANDTAVETTEAGINGLELVKSANPDFVEAVAVPADIDFTFLASNSGVRPVSAVAINDDQCSPVTYVTGDTNIDNLLDPGETWEFSCTLAGLTADVVNTATVSGNDPVLGSISSQPATASVSVIAPEISITKSPANQNAPVGGQAVFSITVENTGDTELAQIVVSDPTAPSCDRYLPSLAVGATFTYECFLDHGLSAGGTGTNTINVAALDPGGAPVADVDSADYTAFTSDLAITKTNDATGDLYPGDAVTYTITVENTSGVDQNDVTVTDVLPPGIDFVGPTTVVAPTLVSGSVASDSFDTDVVFDGGTGWVANAPNSLLITSATDSAVTIGTTDWVDQDNGAASQDNVGENNALEIAGNGTTDAVGGQQVLDLTAYTAASISFDCDTENFNSSDDRGYFYVNDTIVERYRNTDSSDGALILCDPATPRAVNLDAYAGQEIVVGFGAIGDKKFLVDNVSVIGTGGPSPIAGSAFDTGGYLGNTGQWAGRAWFEFGEGTEASKGDIVVNGNVLELAGPDAVGERNWVYRSVDLSANVTASISLDCDTSDFNSADDLGFLAVDGTIVETFRNADNTDTAFVLCDPAVTAHSVDLTPFVGDVVTLAFGVEADKTFVVDTLAITGETFQTTTTTGGASPNLVTAADDIDLPPGGVMTITVPAQVEAGLAPYYPVQEVNTASTTSVEQPTAVSAGSLVDVVVTGLDIVKTADPAVASPGEPVTYTMVVTNTGNDPITPTVTDPDCSPITFVDGDTNTDNLLDQTETWTYQCVTTAAPVTNTATVNGVDTNAVAVTPASDSATIDLVVADIDVAVSTSTPTIRPNETASYAYDVTTNGAVEPLAAVSVVDDTCSPAAPVLSGGVNAGDTNADGLLDQGETWQFGCSTTLSTTTTNTATASGTDRAGGDQLAVDTAVVTVIDPAIDLSVVNLQNDTSPGDPVTFEFTVTNPGNDPLSGVALDNDLCTATYGSGDVDTDDLLDPGETWLFFCNANPTEDVVNYATAEGTDSLGLGWTAVDSAAVNVVTPSIAVGKVADSTVIYATNTVLYDYRVFNDGDTTFTGVNVADDVCTSVTRGPDLAGNDDGQLEPGEAWTYTCSQPLGATTTNTFTVDALVGATVLASGVATEVVTVLDPSVEITTTADVTQLPVGGGDVTYTYEVTNTSPAPSTFHYIALDTPSDDTCTPLVYVSGDDGDGELGFDDVTGLSEVWTYSCTTTITEDTTNTVTATGTDVLGNAIPVDTAQDFVDVVPDVSASKTANPTIVPAAGDDVTFTYRVDNDAAESVDVTAMSDDIYGDLNGQGTCATPQTIAAGGFYECSFTVNVSGPAGGSETNILTVTANDDESNVVAPTATATVDFGDVVIGDFVWLDLDEDGIQDGGFETGRDGVTVNLYDSGDVLVASTVTAGGGLYQFAGQVPGDYYLEFVDPLVAFGPADQGDDALDSDVTDPGAGTTDVFTVIAGDVEDSIDASIRPATVASTVWLDLDGNGLQDGGEPGIEGVVVELRDAGNNVVGSTTTSATGGYSFGDIQPGAYDVTVVYPGATFSPQDAGADDTVDSDVDPTGSVSITLSSGPNDPADAGVLPAAMGDYTWLDGDGDGIQDAAAPDVDLSGVTVTATAGTGQIFSTVTVADGSYTLAVAPGTYSVQFAGPAGGSWVPTLQDSASATEATDSDVDGTGTLAGVTVVSSDLVDIDAGFYEPVSISGLVWDDADGSQAVSGAEAGLADIAVTAVHLPTGTSYPAVDPDGTDGLGQYSFVNLPPGDYTITVDELDADLPVSYVSTTGNNPESRTLASGEVLTDVDFGYAALASIGDRVFLDVNGNGVDDAEPGIEGLAVTLDDGLNPPSSTTTDSNGNYGFAAVPGDYTVTVTAPAGGAFVPAGAGAEPVDSDVNAGGSTGVVNFPAGDNTDLADAGIAPAIIDSTVWLDLNGNGVQELGEIGIDGVTVELFDTSGALPVSLGTARTGPTGGYSFTGLEPGRPYEVRVLAPEASFSPNGPDSDVTPGAATSGGGIVPVVLSSGSNDVADAGVLPAEITSTVWVDLDLDGVQALPSDAGVSGVQVTLTDADSNSMSVFTDANGDFTFDDLVPGTFSVQVVYPEATFVTIGDSDVDAGGLAAPIVLQSGTNDDEADAPVVPAVIGDVVFLDTDDDGDQTGEPGVAGVIVTLFDAAGTTQIGLPVLTGASGDYQFSVAPGDYTVVVTAPSGATFVAQGAGSATDSDVDAAGSTGAVTFVSGDNTDLADAGFVAAVLTSSVWLDANGNGSRDPGEPGIEGVDVTVTDGFGVPVTVTTGPGGVYTVPGLLPGDVDVDVVYDAATFVPVGADSDVAPATGDATVTLVSGPNGGAADAGVVPAVISDFAWDDLNGNGVQDSGEPGLDGVIVDAVGGPGAATYSDTSTGGGYSVAVAPGDYVVTYTAPAGYVPTQLDQGGDDTTDSDLTAAGTITLNGLTSGSDDSVDAGFFVPVQVTGTVWADVDGSQTNNGEAGLVGVDVTLDDGVNPPVTIQTTAGGVYDFGAVPPGDYTITVGPGGIPAGYVSTTNNSPAAITLVSNTPQAGPDFGYAALASIGDRVFLDLNGNGTDDAEPGVEGAIATLFDDAGVQIAVPVVTDATGGYRFPGVVPGDYEVRVSGLPATYSPQGVGAEATDSDVDPVTGSTGVVNFASGDQGDLADAGVLPAVLNSNVFLDVDGDGTIDAEDIGIEGVTVEIYDAGGVLAGSAVTGPNGDYTIGGLAPGDYDVQVVYPDAVFSTGTDSDVDVAGAVSVTLSSNDNDDVADAGVLPAVTGDLVWVDTDGDGVQGSGEPGLDAVSIAATSLATGQTFSTTSNPDGSYVLNTPPGDFAVVFAPPAGYDVTQQDAGGDDLVDSDIDPIARDITLTGLVSGSLDTTVDAGFYLPVTIDGTVWDDENGNQTIDTGENGIDAVAVTAVNATNGVTYPGTTIADGSYSFTGLAPGDYTVTVTETDLPAGYLSTTANNPETFTVVSDDAVADLDFGYAAPVTIGGDAWLDLNQDGVQDPGTEPARAGVTVDLHRADGTFVATTTTAPDGSYSFPGELPGEYYLEFSDPLAGTTFGAPFQGGDPALDSDITDPANGRTDTFLIAGGTVEATIDASIVAQPPIANDDGPIVIEIDTVAQTPIDVVDNDTDPEDDIVAPTANITCAGCGDVANGTLLNVGDGTFTYVPDPGYAGPDSFTYEVCDSTGQCDTATVTIDVNDLPVVDDDTAATVENVPVVIDVLDNDDDPDGLDPATVTVVTPPTNGTTSIDPVTGEVTYTPNDAFDGTDTFEYQVCDVLGSCEIATATVRIDGTPTIVGDTAMTNEDTPVTIEVLDNDSDADGIDPTAVSVTTVPANGTISVDPTTGDITYTPTTGFVGTDTFVYEACDNDGDCAEATVTVTVVPTWSITGRVWLDDDRDGVLDGSENDISGVRLVLTGPGDDGVIGTSDDVELDDAFTASLYEFTGLVDGTYQITVDTSSLPAGVGITFDLDGGDDGVAVAAVAGADVVEQDFGYAYPALTGTMTDASGAPVGGARLSFVDAEGNTFTTTTAADGTYLLESGPGREFAFGSGTITVRWPNGTTSSATVTIFGAQVTVQNLVSPASIGNIPSTGSSTDELVKLGSFVVLIGIGFYLVGRRRRGNRSVATG